MPSRKNKTDKVDMNTRGQGGARTLDRESLRRWPLRKEVREVAMWCHWAVRGPSWQRNQLHISAKKTEDSPGHKSQERVLVRFQRQSTF